LHHFACSSVRRCLPSCGEQAVSRVALHLFPAAAAANASYIR
jgi:hypothetical protein